MENYKVNSVFKPETCVFVSANAGSGKTSLLVNRVLSLLLHKISPEKILCLTFTNAAAAEMSSRILNALASWVMANDEELEKQISKLISDTPNPALLAYARGLFASVLEAPQGVNIQTIHGFSQSLLRRFPLEAGISPHFTVMDSRSEQEIIVEARLRLFNHAQKSDSTIQQSVDSLARTLSESGFNKLISEIVGNKRKFYQLLQDNGDLSAIQYLLCNKFRISINETPESLLEKHFVYDKRQLLALQKIAEILLQSEKSVDTQTGARIADWLDQTQARIELANVYISNFLTIKGTPRKTIFSKNILQDDSLIEELLAEQQRVYEFNDRLNALSVVRHSMDVLVIAESLLAEYEAIKRSHAWIDYDDLIMISCNLLTRVGMLPWVLFKLDGGIDHILVDEAQDTSLQQWKIVDALTQEFFVGQGAKDIDRSLFIVGDEKQSIFSFQGANVKELARMQKYFEEIIKSAQKPVYLLSLTESYRSTDVVLQAVDAVFSLPEARVGVTSGNTVFAHIPTRTGQAGVVELWPLIKPSNDENKNPISPTTKLVQHIADTIKGWIENGEVQAGEIMILLRSRTVLADKLVRALKRRGVSVAGSDRMALNDNLVVQDLIALGQVLLLPDDDLTLAACLKSPIFNLSEDDLFTLAYDRGGQTLWERLGQNQKFVKSYELLVELRSKADFIAPFELYSYLLGNCGARARFVGRMGEECTDPLDEFMQQTLLYERSHPPSLQGFIHWLSNSNSIIKRDMEQSRDAVRIMTIHGAKGLQAKVVILPDTVEIPKEQGSLLWLDDKIPIRSIASGQDDIICKQLRAQRQQETLSEYRRLLYVALTRAEDRLYICGATGKDKISEHSWYSLVEKGLDSLLCPLPSEEGGVRVLQQTMNTICKNSISIAFPQQQKKYPECYFSFLQKPLPAEPSPHKPLVPSHISDDLPATPSPLINKAIYATGKFIHLLLQYLPTQEAKKREDSAKIIAQKFSTQLPTEIIDKAISDALAVINNQEFAFLFSKDSLAEVPITGNVEIGGEIITVSGQIDRLYMGENEVWIVDFKSNQLPPILSANIPIAYIRQLGLYKLLLQQITPKKTVHCALLWTAIAKLDVISNAMLDEWLASSYI